MAVREPTSPPQIQLHRLRMSYEEYLQWADEDTHAEWEVRIRPGRSSREPDILFIANKNLDRLSEDRFVGPPDLIVEIVSADSTQHDRRDKFNEYHEAGVPEYWIIDPRRNKQRADFYILNKQGQYDLFATEENKRMESHILPGFWLKPEWLSEPGADPQLRFYEMAGMAAETIEQIRRQLQAGLRPK